MGLAATDRRQIRAANYARVSTLDQQPENQLQELRRYVAARGWDATEYVDHGISDSRVSRPAFDRMLRDARCRRIDAVVVWRLDRLGRSLRHLIVTIEELDRLGVTFVSIGEGIDLSTPSGRLQMAILAAISQFERERIVELTGPGFSVHYEGESAAVHAMTPRRNVRRLACRRDRSRPPDTACRAFSFHRLAGVNEE